MLAAVALILSCAGVLVAEEAVSHKAAFGKDGARIFSKRKMVEMDKLPLNGNVSSKSMAGVNPLAVSADVAMQRASPNRCASARAFFDQAPLTM